MNDSMASLDYYELHLMESTERLLKVRDNCVLLRDSMRHKPAACASGFMDEVSREINAINRIIRERQTF